MIKNKKDITLPSFDDLEFQDHPNTPDGVQARLSFGHDDRFDISVVSMKGKEQQFGGLYGSVVDNTYEVALYHYNRMLPLSVSDDVLGWQTPTDITRLMRQAILNDFAWVTLLQEARDEWRRELDLD
jgi:hypothetical protein